MSNGPIVRRISFDIHGEFITQLAREWFYTGEKSHEKVIEILMDSMTGTDTPEAQIRRYAEDILLGRAALKGSTAAGTYHLETYEPGEEEDGCFCTIHSRESQFQQGTSPESTRRRRKSSCMTITWKETAKRRRTQYGRTNENR